MTEFVVMYACGHTIWYRERERIGYVVRNEEIRREDVHINSYSISRMDCSCEHVRRSTYQFRRDVASFTTRGGRR